MNIFRTSFSCSGIVINFIIYDLSKPERNKYKKLKRVNGLKSNNKRYRVAHFYITSTTLTTIVLIKPQLKY